MHLPPLSSLFRRPPAERRAPRLDGTLERLPSVVSRFLPAPRDVLVYLPPGYDAGSRRYPVLYMQDGQNLFDPATAYVKGKDWRLGETVDALIAAGAIEPLIVVGIHNTGIERVDEYTPTRDPRRKTGGQADLYVKLLAEELKPFVDSRYRTLPSPDATGLGGSSLGGLFSLYAGLLRPDVFGRLALMSPSVWWDGEVVVKMVDALPAKLALRIWLDMGTREGDEALAGARHLKGALVAKGWEPGHDLSYLEARGARHDEEAWGRRVGRVLRFLYPRRRAWRSLIRMRRQEVPA
jgi:predicted alpha/beta superfamily hydrolase